MFIGNFEDSFYVLPRKPVAVETVKAVGSTSESVTTTTKTGAAVGAAAGIIGFVFGFAMAGIFLKFS